MQVDREIDRWLGLAHGCRVEAGGFKFYWHYWFEVDSAGVMLSLSDPFKIDADIGIEFAAGLVYDRAAGELVVSYGLEDDRAMLGITEISAVLALLRPIGAAAKPPGPREDDHPQDADARALIGEAWESIAAGKPIVRPPTWQPKPQPTMASMRAAIELSAREHPRS